MIAMTLNNLGSNLFRLGRIEESIILTREAVEDLQRVYGPDHVRVLDARNNLAIRYVAMRRFQEAEAIYRDVELSYRRAYGPEYPGIGIAHYNLACLAAKSGDLEKALRLLRETLDVRMPAVLAVHVADDDDLAALHGDPRFDALVAAFKERGPPSAPGTAKR